MTAPAGYVTEFSESWSKTVAEGHYFDAANYGSTWVQYSSSTDGNQGNWVKDSLVSVPPAGIMQIRCYTDGTGSYSASPLQHVFPGQTGFASGQTYYRWKF